MNINFRSIDYRTPEVQGPDLEEHAKWLSNLKYTGFSDHSIDYDRVPPPGFENYYCVDVFGKEFEWMNNAFPKEKFTWYLWFESIFLVPEEMLTFLTLKWSE